jgi:outer membrane murein-binding lipoprotein Lpp
MRHFPTVAAPVLALAAVVVALLVLTGCARGENGPSKEKVQSALHTLSADPDAVHFQTFVATSPATGQLSQQVLLLVPVPGGAGYKIVDAQGEIFDDYETFLRDNTLPDQPGPG